MQTILVGKSPKNAAKRQTQKRHFAQKHAIPAFVIPPLVSTQQDPEFWGSVFGRTDFSRIFIFGPRGFFRGFSRRIFSPQFCGEKCPEKSSRKIPGKILQNLYNKNPRHISAEGPAQEFVPADSWLEIIQVQLGGSSLSDLKWRSLCKQQVEAAWCSSCGPCGWREVPYT